MKKSTRMFLLIICLIFNYTICFSTTIDVEWGSVIPVSTTKAGSIYTTEFGLNIPSLGVTTYGYCVEPTSSIHQQSYEFSLLSLNYDPAKATGFYQAAWLMDNYAPGHGSSTTGDDINKAAALQGEIWKLTNGSSYTLTNTGIIGSYYKTYSQAIADLTLTDFLKSYLDSHFMLAHNSVCQDLIIELPHNPVPEPATMFLFGTGILGLIKLRRRK
jgi:hypothetical protein